MSIKQGNNYIASGGSSIVDQTYSATSTNAQSGTAVASAISGKQDTLVSGSNIKTINNNSILGSGNVDIDALPSQIGQSGKFLTTNGTNASWSQVDITPDNKSITKNASDELQTVGVINQNDTTTAVKTWTGTKAQYDAIVTKDANTLYNITDDTDVSLTILEALYPVGSVYITTANTCPLSTLISGSTWELVSSGRVLQGADSGHSAGTTVEAGLPNISGTVSSPKQLIANYNLSTATGAFSSGGQYGASNSIILPGNTSSSYQALVNFSAQNSNSIYGNSNTVQPPAYIVNIYRRTA